MTDGERPDASQSGTTQAAPMGGSQMAANAVAYWTATGVGLVGSLLRGKVAAVVLGTQGLGITSQLATFATLIAALAALGLGTGGVKMIAQARAQQNEDETRRLVSFLVWAPAAAGVLVFVAVVVLARPLSQYLLGDEKYSTLLIVATIAVPLSLLLASFQLVMQAFERARRLAVNSIITAVLVTIAAVPLTVSFGVEGAVAAGPISAVATLIFFVLREPWVMRHALPLRRLDRVSGAHLRLLAGASLASSLLALGTDTILRAATVHQLGLKANGLYQPVQMLSTVVLAQMAGALALVLLPRLTIQLQGDRSEVVRTLRLAARTAVVFIVPTVLVLMGLRDVFIVIFFDRSFLGVSDVLSVQLTGELPRFLAFTLGAVLLPASLVRQWFLTTVFGALARLALGLFLLPHLGLMALAIGTVAQWVIVTGYTAWALRQRMAWSPDRELLRLSLVGALVLSIGCAVAVEVPWQAPILLAAASAWVALLGRSEVRQLMSVAAPRLGRARR